MNIRKTSLIVAFLLTIALSFAPAFSAQKAQTSGVPKDLKDYAERSQESAKVLSEVMRIPEEGIPADLMKRAHAIAVIPHVIKGAFGIGGRYGKGLITTRMQNGRWSSPAFVEIGGGSFGLQLGATATDLILVFTNDTGVKGLLDGKVTLGADASVAAGPVGRQASAATDVTLRSAIYSYSRSKGLFAGVSLEGAALTMDDSANRKVYGENLDGKDILMEGKASVNNVVRPFLAAVEKYTPATKTTAR